jgi:hypothetical protein
MITIRVDNVNRGHICNKTNEPRFWQTVRTSNYNRPTPQKRKNLNLAHAGPSLVSSDVCNISISIGKTWINTTERGLTTVAIV